MSNAREEAPRCRTYNRRTFLRTALGTAALSAGSSVLAACGGNSNPTATSAPTAAPNPTSAATSGTSPTTASGTVTSSAAAGVTAASTKSAGAAVSSSSVSGTTAASPVAAVDGKIPSPALELGVPDGYTKLPPLFKSVNGVPGKGGKITAFLITYGPPAPPRDQNKYWQELEKRLGVTVEPAITPAGDYQEKAAAVIAGGDLPDYMFLSPNVYSPEQFQTISQGAFTDLTPHLTGDALKEYPNLARLPAYAWKNSAVKGKIYGVPYPLARANVSFYFRQDWAEKVGMPNPKNADEFMQQMIAFTKGDPDGNGSQDTWALTHQGSRPDFDLSMIQQMFRAPNGWRKNPDGTLIRNYETDEYKQALDFTRKLYAAGIFHPDATTMTVNQAKDAFFASKVGAYTDGLGGLLGSRGARGKTKGLTPTANVTGWIPMGHDGGKPVYHTFIGYLGFTAISAKVGKDPARLKELLSILNYVAAPFGSEENLFLVNGIEGVHYELKNGVPIANDRGKSEIAVIPFLAGAAPVAFYDVPGDAQYMQKMSLDLLTNAIDDPTWGLYSPANVKMGPQLAQSVSDKIVAIVTGREQLSAWDAFLKDYNSRGNDQVRKEYQDALKAQ